MALGLVVDAYLFTSITDGRMMVMATWAATGEYQILQTELILLDDGESVGGIVSVNVLQ
jgi:hypothetical protein